jgi:hypothetical protein
MSEASDEPPPRQEVAPGNLMEAGVLAAAFEMINDGLSVVPGKRPGSVEYRLARLLALHV